MNRGDEALWVGGGQKDLWAPGWLESHRREGMGPLRKATAPVQHTKAEARARGQRQSRMQVTGVAGGTGARKHCPGLRGG